MINCKQIILICMLAAIPGASEEDGDDERSHDQRLWICKTIKHPQVHTRYRLRYEHVGANSSLICINHVVTAATRIQPRHRPRILACACCGLNICWVNQEPSIQCTKIGLSLSGGLVAHKWIKSHRCLLNSVHGQASVPIWWNACLSVSHHLPRTLGYGIEFVSMQLLQLVIDVSLLCSR